MSSSSFNIIRRQSYDKIGVHIKELTQQLATNRSKLEGSQLETDDVRSQGRMDHSTIKLNDERLSFGTVLSSSNTDFYYELQEEPDLDKLKVWFMLDHLGAKLKDMSGFGNDAYISGHPTLRRAFLDLGYQQLETSPAIAVMSFNSGTDVVSQTDGEYIYIPNNESIQFSRLDTGFSIHFRFNCSNFASHIPLEGGSYSRRFASKTDDPLNGWNILVYPTGSIVNGMATHGGVEVEIMDNGVQYARRTSGYTSGFWYQVVITYDPLAGPSTDDRIKIYTGGFENSVDSSFGTILSTDTDLKIGARSSSTGFFHGYIHDFRMWFGKILTQQEVTNINQNELTISNIPKGHSFIVQYALVQQPISKKTHKWVTVGRIIKVKSHRYNVIELVISSKSHLYNLIERIVPLRTHKYTIIELVMRLLTIVYDQGGIVTLQKTHKFYLLNKLTTTKTHKYNVGVQGLQTQYQRFTKSITAGSNITQEITFTSTPQAIIVWSDGNTADNTLADQYSTYYGFSDGTHHACVSGISVDNVGTTDTFSGHKDDKVIALMNNTTATMSAEATVSFTNNKAIFNWTTNDNRAVYIHTLALYNIDKAEVKTFTTGTTSTGNKIYTLNDASLTPTFVHVINRSGPLGWSSSYAQSISIGAGKLSPSLKQFAVTNANDDDVGTTDVETRFLTNACLTSTADNVDANELMRASLSSCSAGSFTMNYSNSPSSSSHVFSVLVLNSANIGIGTITQPASTGTQVVTTDTNVDSVRGIMMYSNGQVTADTYYSTAEISIGGSSGTTTNQGVTTTNEIHDLDTSVTVRTNKTGSIAKIVTANATATSSTTDAETAVSAMGTDQFTLNWTVTSSTARKYHYIVFGAPT